MRIRDLSPDAVFSGGRIYTLDESNSVVGALAIKDGRVLATGGSDEIDALAGPATRRIDLAGRCAIPGLFDSHVHLLEDGGKLAQIRLDEAESPEEMCELVRERASQTPPGTWIVGQGWNEGRFRDKRLPTRADIDPATSDHPVLLMRFFNTDVINSCALRLAGIDRNTPDPENGNIERDADGEPNGLLRAKAKRLARRLLPTPTAEELVHNIALGQADLHQYGITSVIEPGLRPPEIRAYQRFHQAGRLALRATLMPSWHGFFDDETEVQLDYRSHELGVFTGLGDDWLRLGGLKLAIDGGTTPHTAYMYEPFLGESEVKNYNRLDTHDLERFFCSARETHWDVGIHCCGDRAQDMAVDAFALAAGEYPAHDTRNHIIHAYFPSAHALEVMSRCGIAACIQPTFIYWEGDAVFRDVGEARAANYKPARRYLDAGVRIASSSDVASTVVADAFVGMYTLVTRKNAAGQLIAPDQGISRLEALQSYTTGGAWLVHSEGVQGTLEPGKYADMAVLDRDYFEVPEDEIKQTRVLMTICGGEVVYSRWAGGEQVLR